MANYFCANCGTAHGPTDVFCRACGAQITRHNIAQPNVEQSAAPQPAPTATNTEPVASGIPPESYVPQPVMPPRFGYAKAPKRVWPKVLGIVAAVVAFAALALVLIIVLINNFQQAPDPRLAIVGARDAFVQHDEQAFEQNVDVDAVLGNAIDQTAAYAAAQSTQGNSNGDKLAAQGVGYLVAQVVKEQEMNELHNDVQQLVSGVAIQPQNSNQDAADVYLVPLMHALLESGVTYEGSTVLEQSGSTAVVEVHLQPPLGASAIDFDVNLHLENGRWRIVSLPHLDRLLALLPNS